MHLDALFRPKSIAVIGASDKPTIGRRLINSLDRIGFAGSIYPVNPNYSTVLGRRCWPAIAALPEAPDVGLSCMGHERLLNAFVAASECGIRAAVVYDGGFAEQGDDGRRLQAKIAAICREAGIALCGPDCMGVLNPYHPSTTYLQELHDPSGLAGNVGIVSQSWAVCVSLLTDTRRFGFSHIVSSGNEAVLTAADCLEYLAGDPQTSTFPSLPLGRRGRGPRRRRGRARCAAGPKREFPHLTQPSPPPRAEREKIGAVMTNALYHGDNLDVVRKADCCGSSALLSRLSGNRSVSAPLLTMPERRASRSWRCRLAAHRAPGAE